MYQSQRHPRSRAGFSIVQVFGTVMCVAIAAGIAIPMYFSRPGITLENACVLLANDLRLAQNNAAYTGKVMIVTIDEDGGGYAVLNEHGAIVENPRTGKPFQRRYDRDGVFRGVRVRLVELGEDRALAYDTLGYATEGGRIVLSFDGETREVQIDAKSGDLSIPNSSSGWVDPGF